MKKNKTGAAAAAAPKKPFLKKLKDSRTLLLMCLPAILFFIVFNYCPLPGVYIAFTNYNFRDGIFGSPFVGFKNFEFLIRSGELWHLTRNTVLYNLAFIVIGNVLQIALAIMLNEIGSKLFKKVSQTLMFLPYFISVVLIGAIAFNILNYDTGALNSRPEETRSRFTARRASGRLSFCSATSGSRPDTVPWCISRQSAELTRA